MRSARSVRSVAAALVAAAAFCAPLASVVLGMLGAAGCDDGPGVPTDQTKPGEGTGGSGGAAAAGNAGAGGGTVKPASLIIYANRGSGADGASNGGCPSTTPNDASFDTSYVVQWTIVDECTGLGGQHLVAKDLDSTRQFFLGGHGCYDLPPEGFQTFPSPPLRYGVLRGRQTAALFTAGPCVALPTDPPMPSPNPTMIDSIQTDLIAVRLESYETLADARAARLALRRQPGSSRRDRSTGRAGPPNHRKPSLSLPGGCSAGAARPCAGAPAAASRFSRHEPLWHRQTPDPHVGHQPRTRGVDDWGEQSVLSV